MNWLRCFALAVVGVMGGADFSVAAEEKKAEATVQDKAGADANQSWNDLQKALRPPNPPAEWATNKPSEEEMAKFNKQRGAAAGEAAAKAREFYKKFPNDPRAKEAQKRELNLLKVAVQTGNANYAAQLDAAEKASGGGDDAKEKAGAETAKTGDSKSSSKEEDERFMARIRQLQKAAMKARDAEFEKGALQLVKEFPNRADVYELLTDIASRAEPDKMREIVKMVLDSKVATEEAKEAAQTLLKKADAVGKPVDIKFTALDKREVDVTNMKGKVVLIDFWATWCGPCVQELPNVKAAYDKLHGKGFEIVGISLDQKKTALERFVDDEKMPWPQYFDGAGWGNKFARQFGINSIPAMWLIDKKGNLRDTDAGDGLLEKVEKLLAEK